MAQQIPAAGTSFVGREEELATLERLVRDGARVITLKGPGGAGKTRTALAYADRARQDPELNGVLFASLAAASDAEQACEAIASAFELSFGGRGSLALQIERTVSQLGPCLIVIDNVDQLSEALAPLVASWSRAASEAVWLVTSRERLRIPEEHVFDVPPLAGEAAIRLFLDRARSRRVGFEPSAEEQATIGEIVARLDGLPLAIELCAARMGVLGVTQMLEQLSEGLELLSSRMRGAPARHATLSAAVRSSWSALSSDEQATLSALCVFVNGFDLEAAAHILARPPSATLGLLETLGDKSLLVTYAPNEQVGTLRFTLLSSIREYAREHSGEREELERRHAEYFADAERWSPTPMRRREVELENLYAAARRLQAWGDERALSALEILEPLQTGQGISPRFAHALDQNITTLPSARGHELRGFVRLAAGELALAREDAERAKSWLLTAMIESTLGNVSRADAAFERVATASARYHQLFAEHACRSGRMDEALQHATLARDEHRKAGNARDEGHALVTLGLAWAERGVREEAKAHFDAAYELALTSRDVQLLLLASSARATLSQDLADFVELERLWKLHADALSPALEALVLGTLGKPRESTPDRRYDMPFFQRPSSRPAPEISPQNALEVAADANWFRFAGARTDLGRRGPLRRVLCKLVEHHAAGGSQGLTVHELFEAAWPGERASHDAALARVYVTVRRLRKLGLDEALLTRDSGYLLDPELAVRVVP